MLKNVALVGLALTLLSLGGAKAAPGTAGAAPAQLEIPYNAIAYDVWPLWQAIDQGLFRKYGDDVRPGGAMQSPAIVASILSGETKFAIVGEDAVISADLNGGDIVILTSDTEKLLLAVFATPAVHNVAGLKGKKIAISQFGTTTDFLARYVLQHAGLEAVKDVALVPVGSLANRVAALQSGAADAAIIGPPITFKAEKLGFHAIANMYDYDLLFYTSSLVAKRSWVKTHRTETLNVIRGYIAGGASIAHDKAAAVASLSKYTKVNDPEILQKTYQGYMKVLLKVPVPKTAAIETGLAQSKLPAAKKADPAQFIDPSFVEALDKDGFIASLYRQGK